MIIVDNALRAREAEGNPIRVGLIGAGFMARGLANQIINVTPGMRLVAIFNRTVERAIDVYRYADPDLAPLIADSRRELDDAIRAGRPVVTGDATLLTRSEQIDILVDVTGAVEFGAHVALDAFRHGKHVILMNAELDATLGPILQTYAKRAGVILSACDGDQPGVEINLFRFVKGMGLIPRVMGNIKGLQDPYRTPTTQKAFAERWGQSPSMVTSFADGSKVSFEQAVVANATGMRVARRGMLAYEHREHVDTLTTRYDIDMLRELGGIVEYVVGAQPGPGVFCLAEHTDPRQRHYLNLYKLGEGPLYSFYRPYHLCHFEVPNTVGRIVLFGDTVGEPLGGPTVEVCAVAKRELKAGETLDDYGHYMTYGEAANVDEMRAKRYLPEGLVEGCFLKRNIARDQVITFDDVELPKGRLADSLYAEQCAAFPLDTSDNFEQDSELVGGRFGWRDARPMIGALLTFGLEQVATFL
jgi:predicted homoserine dehydrogenase-like protein